jgi:hypothetical protein
LRLFRNPKLKVSPDLLGILTSQKELVGGVLGFIPVPIAKRSKKFKEAALVCWRYLQAHKNTSVVRAMIAVMKERDIPAGV